jgi:hypothetical protein
MHFEGLGLIHSIYYLMILGGNTNYLHIKNEKEIVVGAHGPKRPMHDIMQHVRGWSK